MRTQTSLIALLILCALAPGNAAGQACVGGTSSAGDTDVGVGISQQDGANSYSISAARTLGAGTFGVSLSGSSASVAGISIDGVTPMVRATREQPLALCPTASLQYGLESGARTTGASFGGALGVRMEVDGRAGAILVPFVNPAWSFSRISTDVSTRTVDYGTLGVTYGTSLAIGSYGASVSLTHYPGGGSAPVWDAGVGVTF